MKALVIAAAAVLPLLANVSAAQAYDNDDQELRMRDTVADPQVPLPWDRRDHPETWRYRYDSDQAGRRCGKRAYWDGDECVLKQRYR